MKKVVFLSLIAVFLLSGALFAAPSRVAADGHTILKFDTMVGVPRPYTGAANAIRSIPGGGLPWVVGSADGELKADGKLEVRVSGLVIDPNDPAAIAAGRGGTNPSPTFIAIVSCLTRDKSGTTASTVNLQTKAFPASPSGNANIEATVSLPHPCIAPIVFVASPAGSWFAATGAQ